MDSSKDLIPKTLVDVPLDAMRILPISKILSILWAPCSSILTSSLFYSIIRQNYFKELFNIPELIEDDIEITMKRAQVYYFFF